MNDSKLQFDRKSHVLYSSTEESLILPIFRKLRFVDCNKPFWKS